MSNYSNKLGFDSFDRSGETYCCSNACDANTISSSSFSTIKSFATNEGKIKLDTDGIVYHGQSLTNAFDNLKSSMVSLQSRLTDAFSQVSVLNNRLNKFEIDLNSFKKNNCEKENQRGIQHIDRSMFKTLKYDGR